MVSKTIYVVASGNTLRGFDFEKLRGGEIITVNDNFRFIPFAQHLVILDLKFYKQYKRELRSFKGKIYNDRGILGSIPIPTTSINNSGYSAIKLAMSFHPRIIHLLGFDLCREKYVHHFDDQPVPNFTNFQRVANAINEINTRIKIYNYSDVSIITKFPKIPLIDLPLPFCTKNGTK